MQPETTFQFLYLWQNLHLYVSHKEPRFPASHLNSSFHVLKILKQFNLLTIPSGALKSAFHWELTTYFL